MLAFDTSFKACVELFLKVLIDFLEKQGIQKPFFAYKINVYPTSF